MRLVQVSAGHEGGQEQREDGTAAFDRYCIPSGCVAPRSNTADVLLHHTSPDEPITNFDAKLGDHHGLLTWMVRARLSMLAFIVSCLFPHTRIIR